MKQLVYQIPVSKLAAYRGQDLIVRAGQPSEFASEIGANDLDNLVYIQLGALPDNADGLIQWIRDLGAEGLAIDLHLSDPAKNFAHLYRYVELLANHPVRVSIPVATDFEKAVKLAVSLQFAVKLQVGQPTPVLIGPLTRLLDDYLHRSTVAQPVEFFHSLLFGLLRSQPADLWAIQEEDPALVRYVDDQGRERPPGELAESELGADPDAFVERWLDGLVAEGTECAECPYARTCRGYFKWPHRGYDCAGVKTIFQALTEAALELGSDLAQVPSSTGARGP